MADLKERSEYKPDKTIVCIRDDGYICMANQNGIQLSMGRLRPYNGDLDASLEERMAYIRGDRPRTKDLAFREELEKGEADIEKMDRGQLIEYAMDEYGLNLTKGKLTEADMRGKIIEARMLLKVPAAQESPGIGASA